MRRRPLRWLVLCFATLWFGVLVPVHNRGEIAVPGSGAGSTPTSHCHSASSTQADAGSRHCPEKKPCPARACAVCFFVAGLDTPPPVTTVVTRHGTAGVLDLPPPAEPSAARITLPFHSRAPPLA